jgi:hypothetical protein
MQHTGLFVLRLIEGIEALEVRIRLVSMRSGGSIEGKSGKIEELVVERGVKQETCSDRNEEEGKKISEFRHVDM